VRIGLPLRRGLEARMSATDTTSQRERAWRAVDTALDFLNDWYEANVADYADDEPTNVGPTMGEIREMLEAGTLVLKRPHADPASPVVVITRHPDYPNAITVHGGDVRIVDIDLGSSFDMSRTAQYDDADEAEQYALGLEEEISDLPAGHPARREVEDTISEIRAWARGEA